MSALVVDRARGWPALSPPLLAARAFREALVRRGVTVGGRPGLGIAPAAAMSLATDVSDPLAMIVRRMNREAAVLVHDTELLGLIDSWLTVLDSDAFVDVLKQSCVQPGV